MPRRRPFGFLTGQTNEFEFFLAAELGMTVGRLRAEMTNEEFVQWQSYYKVRGQREELANLKAGRKR